MDSLADAGTLPGRQLRQHPRAHWWRVRWKHSLSGLSLEGCSRSARPAP